MDIELRHLRYFVAVAESLSFTRAAERLNIAQPPLSQQIRKLEEIIGTPLLFRTSRHVELTPAGEAFLVSARRTLGGAKESVEVARRASQGYTASIRVGYTDSAALSVLPRALRLFRAAYRRVHLELIDGSTRDQLLAVEHNQVDVALVRGPVSSPLLHIRHIFSEPFVLALARDHRLAKRRRLAISTLSGEPLVLFPRRLQPEFHDVILQMFLRAGITPNVAHEAADYQSIIALVQGGLGVSVVPKSASTISSETVVYRTLPRSAGSAEIVAVFKDKRVSEPVLKFMEAASGSVLRAVVTE
jgi:DNA-binding transcriptional LysR family regulator